LPELDELGHELSAALVVARLRRQLREEVAEPPARAPQEDTFARALQQHLRDHQAEQLVVVDEQGPAAADAGVRRKERAGGAIDCDKQGVKVGAHVGLRVDGVVTPPTFDPSFSGPFLVTNGKAVACVNSRSSI
jgi:hypothetical protein